MDKSLNNMLANLQQSDDDPDELISNEILSDDTDFGCDVVSGDLIKTTTTVRKGDQAGIKAEVPVPVPAQDNGIMHPAEFEKLSSLEMDKLYAYIKGTRSKPDHVDEAISFIKYMQERVKEQSIKRDKLKQQQQAVILNGRNVSTSTGSSSSTKNSRVIPNKVISVSLCQGSGVVEILLNGGVDDDRKILMSKVFEAMLQHGLKVVNCICTKVNDRLIHTIQSQVSGKISIDPSKLREKLNGVVNLTT